MPACLLSASLMLVAGGLFRADHAAAAEPLRVALYGDSIGAEIAADLQALLTADGPVVLDRNVFGGTNACDWFSEARADAAAFDPDVVVVLFTGNGFTPCMRPAGAAPGSYDLARKTAVDVSALSGLFPRARIFEVGFARSREQERAAGALAPTDPLNLMLASHAYDRVSYVDGASPLLNAGWFTPQLPCSGSDPVTACTDGRVPVRAADGMHLCPVAPEAVEGRLPACPVFSPGARRLAGAVYTSITTSGLVLPAGEAWS